MTSNPLGVRRGFIGRVRSGALRGVLVLVPLVVAGCVTTAPPRVAPGSPLGPPELMTCHKLGQFLICNPAVELASE
jgi:hypothetical protein